MEKKKKLIDLVVLKRLYRNGELFSGEVYGYIQTGILAASVRYDGRKSLRPLHDRNGKLVSCMDCAGKTYRCYRGRLFIVSLAINPN